MRTANPPVVWVRLSGVAMALNQMGLPALFRWMLFKGMQLDYPAHVIVVFSRMLVPVVLLG
ncbi:Uncharacterised protein [Yersinia enterocolitica]|nr:Uncharacterised protein [Yersinia enterocolitica]CQH59992.1 Uncharacterised protein [Yersinia enterocolitica]HDL7681298.1 hypothetical protein [Yersinia enterocolitica]